MNRTRVTVGTLIGILSIAACNMANKEPPVRGEVLGPDQRVEAVNKNGKVTISYVTAATRKYEWDGKGKVVKMIPRDEPFQGKLGLYQPSESWGLNPFEVRIVAEEAVIDFENEDEMYAFLRQSDSYLDWVYTTDGLVVGFSKAPSRKQINIDLYQLLVRGKKTIGLKGARQNAIRLNSR